jgi:hypothetical protein
VLHDVHLLGFPVPLWVRAQEQFQALLREFTLLSFADPEGEGVPQRLLSLMAGFEARFPRVSDEPEERIHAAQVAGQDVIDDLVYPSQTEGAQAVSALLDLLAEADSYCAQAPGMNVLAADPDAVRFRGWFLSAFRDQIAGKPPVPWPDWS